MTGYQLAKARKLVTCLLHSTADSNVKPAELPGLVARMSADQWRAVSFAAGVAVADLPAKRATLALLRSRAA